MVKTVRHVVNPVPAGPDLLGAPLLHWLTENLDINIKFRCSETHFEKPTFDYPTTHAFWVICQKKTCHPDSSTLQLFYIMNKMENVEYIGGLSPPCTNFKEKFPF